MYPFPLLGASQPQRYFCKRERLTPRATRLGPRDKRASISDMHRFNHPSFKPLCAPVCRRDESIGGVDRLWSRAKNGIGRRDLVGMTQGLSVTTKIKTLATFPIKPFLSVKPV